jgi:predicted outer membrane repeat protein
MYTDGTGGVAKPTLKNVKFSDNYGNGGGMYNLNSNPRLLNALFNHNCTSNTYGGGIYNNHSNAVLMNVTLVSNGFCTDYGNACLAGGGIYNDHSNPQLTNTILWSNTAIAGTQISNTVGSVPKIYYSDIEGGCPSGSNCVAGMIDADPLFVDAGASNYRLSSSSPAVDAGNNAYMSLSIDLAGKPRKVDLYRTDTGSGTPPIVDMGAYETQADVIYVDQDATGGLNNGLTWANAYTDLADALTWANDNPGVYLEIWVAEGVYTPGSDRSASFQISRDHVQLYGGFSGSENIREQRDWAAHLTSLSGDIGTQGDSADNSYHVLYLDGVTTQPLGSLTVIDGFTITGGYASESSGANAKGGGLYCAGSGAGHACSPTLANLIFSANAAIQGSGVYADGSAGGASSPRIEQVIFRDNSANEGGGMYNDGGNGGASNPSIEATLFNGNQADSAGGGMYNNGGNSGSSLPTLINVTFSGNQAGVSGGGMYNYGVSGEARPRLVNCILWGNDAPDSPQISNQSATPAITYTDIEGGGYPDTGNLQTDPLFNAPALASTAPTAAGDYHVQAISPVIDAGNSISPTIESDLDGNPRLTGAEVDMGAYEAALVYTLTLSTNGNGSGVITPTAGIYSYFQNTVVTLTAEADNGMLFSGWSGSNDCHYGRVTMVADLACVATFNHAIIHVKQDAPGPVHDGITWETAYQTLQEALDLTNSNPGGVFEIWVAEGVYYPDEGGSHVNNSRSESFRINFNVRLYGGFAGNETSRDQSDWMANPTLLSGDIEQDETLANNAYHVIYVDGVSYNQSIGGTTVIDGFTITAGNAAGSGTDGSGGGMYCYSKRGYACDPSLSHLIFSGNSAAQDGGAIFADGGKISCEDNNSSGESSPTLSDVIITGNTANRGGGMANYAACYGRSSPSLSNVLFSQNSAVYGGAMFNYAKGSYLFIYVTPSLIIYMEYKAYSEPVLTNVTFSDNSASGNGGAIYNQLGVDPDTLFGTVSPTLNNSILWDNTAPSGAQIYNGGLHLFDKGATTSLYHSDLQGVGCDYCFGTGNIAVDPHFVDPAASDYRLKGESPLIDAGEDSECASEDIRDLPRNDWSCDMGAYEVHLVDSTVITKTTALSGTYTFGPTLVKMDFSDVGALITTTVEYWPGPHPYPVGSLGGSGVGWGPYYTLSGQGSSGVVTSGFGMTLTLSAEGINLPFVCKNTSRTWDCAVDGYNEDFAWRSGVSAFSDWAVGSDMDWIYLFLPLVAR